MGGQVGTPNDDCPGDRYLVFAGLRPNDCPRVLPPLRAGVPPRGDWEFQDESSANGVCVYQFTAGRAARPEVAALQQAFGSIGQVNVAPDCRVVVPAGGFASAQAKMSRGGRLTNGKSTVTVAVIDGPLARDREPALHADVVRKVISDTACGGSACAVVLKDYNAFGDSSAGPHYLSGLAAAINRALDASGEGRLIMNLSLGWFHGNTMRGQGPAVVPVLKALARARCRNALVISAAGNAVNGIAPSVPFYPGGFQRTPYARPGSGPAPFVYAVSADTTDGVLFATTHTASPISALGFAEDQLGATWMGSSIATAVVSGAAASVWSQFPHLTGDEVMKAIVKGGTPTRLPAAVPAAGWLAGVTPLHVNVADAWRAAQGLPAGATTFVPMQVAPLPSTAPSISATSGPTTQLIAISAADMSLKTQPDIIRCRACTCRPQDRKFDADLETPPTGDWHRAEVVLKYADGPPMTKTFDRTTQAVMMNGTPVIVTSMCIENANNPIVSGYIEVWSEAEFGNSKPGVRNEIVVTRP